MQNSPLTRRWWVEDILAGNHPVEIRYKNQRLRVFSFRSVPDAIPANVGPGPRYLAAHGYRAVDRPYIPPTTCQRKWGATCRYVLATGTGWAPPSSTVGEAEGRLAPCCWDWALCSWRVESWIASKTGHSLTVPGRGSQLSAPDTSPAGETGHRLVPLVGVQGGVE